MTRLNLQSVKLSATPGLFAWSSAYTAGSVFLTIALTKKEEEGTQDDLKELGKRIIDTFEAEYFALPEKTLEGIGKAIEKSLEHIPKTLRVSLACCSLVQDILYVAAVSGGSIQIARSGTFGTILEGSTEEAEIAKGSGVVKPGDRIILATEQFLALVSPEHIQEALETNAGKAKELLTPLLLGQQNAESALLVFVEEEEQETVPGEEHVSKQTEEQTEEEQQEEEIPEEQSQGEQTDLQNGGGQDQLEEEELDTITIEPLSQKPPAHAPPTTPPGQLLDDEEDLPLSSAGQIASVSSIFQTLNLRRFIPSRIPRSKKTVLFAVIIILFILIFGVVSNVKEREQQKRKALFESVYSQAQKKYEEGLALESIEKNSARDDFATAHTILTQNLNKFPKDSSEQKKLDDLLSKVDKELQSSLQAYGVNPKEGTSSIFLDTANSKKDAIAFAQDDKNVYFLSSIGISQVNKQSKQEKQLIKKDWQNVTALSPYLGNLYVLDSATSQIYKFVQTGDGFIKQNYLAGSVDLSKGISMAIDSSVWVLTKEGTIFKFTKGKQDSYQPSGIDKPFSNPTRIATNVDFDNYYVLDNGNARIVVVNKEKGYIAQYQSPLLKNSREFEVSEKAKKVNFLSEGKIYSFELK